LDMSVMSGNIIHRLTVINFLDSLMTSITNFELEIDFAFGLKRATVDGDV
jgi:hypothetical protein